MTTSVAKGVTMAEGMFTAALRRKLMERAPKLLQTLKDDRSGKARLSPTRRNAAMILLRKVMTAQQIEAELAAVTPKAASVRGRT